MAQFYSNENFALDVVEQLRRLGHDVLTSQEAGRAGIGVPDEDVLAFAIAQQRIVLTFDRRDFTRLHAMVPAHCGIVVCKFDPDFGALANRIHIAICRAPDCAGQIVRIVRPHPDAISRNE